MKFKLVEEFSSGNKSTARGALKEDILNENDWWTVPFTDAAGNKNEVSFYASSDADALDLFNQLTRSSPDKRRNYMSATRRQKFSPLIAMLMSGGTYATMTPYKTTTPVNKVTIEDKSLRTKSKNSANRNLGTPKDALLHHKNGDEDIDAPENLVAIDTTNTWLRNVFHKVIEDYRLNTTDTSMKIVHLPITISVPIEEYTPAGHLVQHTGIIEIR